MVHLSIPTKLRPSSRPPTPGTSRTATPRVAGEQDAPGAFLILRAAVIEVCWHSNPIFGRQMANPLYRRVILPENTGQA